MRYSIFILIVLAIFTLIPARIYAHPGNTAADGCHYCRTNCDKWGVPWDERHCHGGAVAPVQQVIETPVQPTQTPIIQEITPTIPPTPQPTIKPTIRPTVKPTIKSTINPFSSQTPKPTITATPSAEVSAQVVQKTQAKKTSGFWDWFLSIF